MGQSNFDMIEGCRNRDPKSMEWLYKNHSPWMLGICMRYFADRMEAEDIVHESFIVICEKIGSLKDEKALESWMKRIVINNCLMALRKKAPTAEIDEVSEGFLQDIEENPSENLKDRILDAEISVDLVLEIMQELPVGFRTVFNLYVFEGFNHQQIATELGISEGTSKSQLLRARKAIQKRLAEWLAEEEKKKERKNVLAYSILFIMNEDLEYIDQLVFNKLNDLRILLESKPPVFNSTNIKSGTEIVRKSFFSSFITKGIIAVMIVGGIVIAIYKVPTKPDKNTSPIDNYNNQTVISSDTVYTDTINYKKPVLQQVDSTINNQQTVHPHDIKPTVVEEKKTVYDTVKVKKVVQIKKKRIVTRSIKKTDTLPH